MECELCGRHSSNLKSVCIEGSNLMVCNECAYYGVENKVHKTPKSISYPVAGPKHSIIVPSDLVDNYGTLIRNARQKRGWTIEDLAKKVFIKNSTMQKIENQALMPEEKIIPKLESLLGIRLKKI